ncbi:MAG: superoxide dismutase [Gammaproteobacteria bacterium]|nr:superoxide dismutase [Gammaproteobacteria bacterium]
MHVLPALPYAVSALEPHIDARTMILHHDQHHASYVKALTHALESAPEVLRRKTAKWLLVNANSLPVSIRTAVRNNAGGHVNHSLFWRAMAPGAGGAPTGALADAIDEACGSFEKFKLAFSRAGANVFGSGWVWLVRPQHRADKLQILTTAGHDNPLTQGQYPLLVNDVWEHAYYLKHENRRTDYLDGWWSVVNWKEAARRFDHSLRAAELPSAIAAEATVAGSN